MDDSQVADDAWLWDRPFPKSLGWLCLALLLSVICVAPLALAIGQKLWFAATIATGYLLAIAAATLLVVQAEKFGLKRGAAVAMGAIGLLCLPCAPNLLRATWSGRKLEVVLPGFGEASAGLRERQGFRRRFARMLRHELMQGYGDGPEDDLLKSVLRTVEGGS